MSMIPKGGDAVWGGLDWSPEADFACSTKKLKMNDTNNDKGCLGSAKRVNYGRIISFGKDVAGRHSSEIERLDFRVMF